MDKSIQELQQPAATANRDVAFVSRRPIYSRSTEVFAYELLSGSDVLDRAILETLIGESLAFVTIPKVFILQDCWRTLPKQKVVLEAPGDLELNGDVVSALTAMKQSGYAISLADFDYSEEKRGLVELADYLNIDFARRQRDEIAGQLLKLKPSSAKTIATRLETHEALDTATALGFDYFRGSCFNAPKLSVPPRVPINRLSTLQLTLKLQEPDLSTAELEKIVSQDLAISYKLLHYVNSAALSLTRTIESIRHAIQMVGTERIRAWASLLLLSKLDDKPAELMITVFVRAKMAQRLAFAQRAANPDTFYMVGLFSGVDTLLNVPMSEAIQLLPFAKPVREALLHHDGPLGHVLKCVLAYEAGDWNEVRAANLDAATIRQCYLDALADTSKLPKLTARDRRDLRTTPIRKL